MLFRGWREKRSHLPSAFPTPLSFFACTNHMFNQSWTSSGAPWTALTGPLIYAPRRPVEVHFITVVDTSFCWTKAGMSFKCSCVNRECPVWSFKAFFLLRFFVLCECSHLHLREHCSSSAARRYLFLAHYLDILGLALFWMWDAQDWGDHTFHYSVAHSLCNA